MLAMERCLMSKQRRTFSPEFKQQAACLVLDQGYSHVEASRSIGVGESLMRQADVTAATRALLLGASQAAQ